MSPARPGLLRRRLAFASVLPLTLATLLATTPAEAQWEPVSPGRGTRSAAVDARSLDQRIAAGAWLRRGDEGRAVRELQKLLNRHGATLAVDGEFGPKTLAAVRAFQTREGLEVDGVIGGRTLGALRSGSLVEALGGEAGRDRETRDRPEDSGASSPARPTPASPVTPAPQDLPAMPDDGVAPSRAGAIAKQRALAAKAAGRSTLLVSFEGLWSYSQSYADKIYRAADAIRAGRRASAPGRASMNFMGKQLVAPQLSKLAGGVEILLMPETSERSQTSIAEATVRAFHEVFGAELRVVVMGHSFGGLAAIRLCKKLETRRIPVAALLTVDARARPGGYDEFRTPSNVAKHWNYFQKSLFLPGYAVDGATLNERVRGHGHGDMPGAPPVVRRFKAIFGL